MRINQFVAKATNLSRRAVDQAIKEGRIKINNSPASVGQLVNSNDLVSLDNKPIKLNESKIIVLVNKPTGIVCSRNGQGSKTVYDLLPDQYRNLKYAGRLDKDSSGLVILSNDGNLINNLTHPRNNKIKLYQIELNKPLKSEDILKIERGVVLLDDRPSKMKLKDFSNSNKQMLVKLYEGRNRQIRRTFAIVGYEVIKLKRLRLGLYSLDQLNNKVYLEITDNNKDYTLVNN